jgi:hypothetical protein
MKPLALPEAREARNMKRLLALAFVLVLTAGCSGGGGGGNPSTPTPTMAPTPSNVAGSYSGSSEDSTSGKGFLSISLTQNGSQVSGSWGVAYPKVLNGGSFSGTVSGSTVQGNATSNVPGGCSIVVTGNLNGSSLSGSYTGTGSSACTSDTGTFTAQTITVPSLGNYGGSFSDAIAGNGTLSINLTQNTVYLAGTWSYTFTNPTYNTAGKLYGVVTSGSTLEFYLAPNVLTACPYVATGTLSGSTISGSYVGVNCTFSDSGTYTVTLL